MYQKALRKLQEELTYDDKYDLFEEKSNRTKKKIKLWYLLKTTTLNFPQSDPTSAQKQHQSEEAPENLDLGEEDHGSIPSVFTLKRRIGCNQNSFKKRLLMRSSKRYDDKENDMPFDYYGK